ncbi:MAG TPA: signal peptide peptidase SppA, partial [Polyangia bacterium]
GFAYVGRDLNTPTVATAAGPESLRRAHDFEMSLRPLGDDRLEVAGGVRVWSTEEADPRARLSLRLVRGLFLEGDFEARQLTLLDPASGQRQTVRDYRGAAGLRVDFDHLTAAVYALVGQPRLGGNEFQGMTALLKITGERQPPLWYGPAQVRRVTLDRDAASDRGFAALMLEIREAERDPSVTAVLLVHDDLALGWGRIEEVRAAVARLRQKGKPVYAYASDLGTRTYYMLAGCDRLWLNPAGDVRLLGLTSNALYFKGTLDKLGVQADFVKIAEYKSAPEAYTRSGSSEPARRQRNELLDDVFGRVVAAVARDRALDTAALRALIDRGPMTPTDARERKLIDAIKYPDEIDDLVAEALGRRVRVRDLDDSPRRPRSWRPPRIAVVFVDGDIVDGKSREVPLLGQRLAGGDSVAAAIRAARGDPDTRAIVLRINSPGGAVTASDQIAREVQRTQGKKPIICSMGDVAASGGYYVAAPCDRVLASPSTTTGSIGIFSGKFDVHGLADRLGLGVETSIRGAHADIASPFRGWTPDERAALERQLRYSYDRFLELVVAGRKLTKGRVDELGRGRVWSGAAALRQGLVDAEGGLLDAIDLAKLRGGLAADEPATIWMLPTVSRTILDRLVGLVGADEGGGRARAQRRPAAEAPLPRALRATLRAVPPALLYSRPGAALYRMELAEVEE